MAVTHDVSPDRTSERVEAYLRCIGLIEREALARAVRRAVPVPGRRDPGGKEDPDMTTETIRSIDAWLSRILAGEDVHDPDQARAVLWVLLPELLGTHPEVFLEPAPPPEVFARALTRARLGIVPPQNNPARMRPQPLGKALPEADRADRRAGAALALRKLLDVLLGK